MIVLSPRCTLSPEDYYKDLSASIDDDAYFVSMMARPLCCYQCAITGIIDLIFDKFFESVALDRYLAGSSSNLLFRFQCQIYLGDCNFCEVVRVGEWIATVSLIFDFINHNPRKQIKRYAFD